LGASDVAYSNRYAYFIANEELNRSEQCQVDKFLISEDYGFQRAFKLKEKKMKTKLLIKVLALFSILMFGASGSVFADTSKLIGQLVDSLGVSQSQAEGGAGAIFKQAKDNMSAGDYSQLASALPGIDSLIKSAPETGGLAGEVTSMFGSSSGSVQGLSALTDSFAKLGLSPEMISKYVNVILEYTKSEAGQQTMELLKNALL
jgi:hypothetical protein